MCSFVYILKALRLPALVEDAAIRCMCGWKEERRGIVRGCRGEKIEGGEENQKSRYSEI